MIVETNRIPPDAQSLFCAMDTTDPANRSTYREPHLQREKSDEITTTMRQLLICDARLQITIDKSPHPVFVKNQHGQYLLANRAMADFYGITITELIGSFQKNFISDTSLLQRLLEDDREVIHKGLPKIDPALRLCDHKGIAHTLHVVKVPLKSAAWNETLVLGVAIDPTFCRQHVPMHLSLAAEYENAAAAITDPLSAANTKAIEAQIEAGPYALFSMRSRLFSDESILPWDIKYLRRLTHSGRQLLRLISQLLSFALIDAKVIDLKFSCFDISIAMHKVLAQLEPLAHRKGVLLVPPDVQALPFITADRTGFNQIFYHLVNNAIKFSSTGSSIDISTRVESDSQPISKGEIPAVVKITVTDRGMGLESLAKTAIFSLSARMTPSPCPPSDYYSMSSLGLVLTRKLVELQGGRIWAESKGRGRGTSVSFVLPVQPKISRCPKRC